MHVTVVVAIGNVDPDAGAHITGTLAPYSSVAVGVAHDSTAPADPVAIPTMFDGIHVMVGAALPEAIVTVKLDSALLPYGSVAVQVTMVFPMGNVDPDAGAHITGTLASYSSVAVGAVQDSTAPEALVAVPVMPEGIPPMVGGVVPALILTVKVAVALFP